MPPLANAGERVKLALRASSRTARSVGAQPKQQSPDCSGLAESGGCSSIVRSKFLPPIVLQLANALSIVLPCWISITPQSKLGKILRSFHSLPSSQLPRSLLLMCFHLEISAYVPHEPGSLQRRESCARRGPSLRHTRSESYPHRKRSGAQHSRHPNCWKRCSDSEN